MAPNTPVKAIIWLSTHDAQAVSDHLELVALSNRILVVMYLEDGAYLQDLRKDDFTKNLEPSIMPAFSACVLATVLS